MKNLPPLKLLFAEFFINISLVYFHDISQLLLDPSGPEFYVIQRFNHRQQFVFDLHCYGRLAQFADFIP